MLNMAESGSPQKKKNKLKKYESSTKILKGWLKNIARESVAKQALSSAGGDMNERQGGGRGGGTGTEAHLYIVKAQPQRVIKTKERKHKKNEAVEKEGIAH